MFDELKDDLKKVFLASVGGVSLGLEKCEEIVDKLVKQGELTVNEGEKLMQELKHNKDSNNVEKLSKAINDLSDEEYKKLKDLINERE